MVVTINWGKQTINQPIRFGMEIYTRKDTEVAEDCKEHDNKKKNDEVVTYKVIW